MDEAKTPEEKRELSSSMLTAALSLDQDQIGPELRDKLIAASMDLAREVPQSKCGNCGLAWFLHEGITIEDVFYCKACGDGLSC